jgi:hypothetical protein
VASASVEHNARAVYSACLRTFEDNRALLREALQYWFENFSASTSFRATLFIDGLMQHIGMTDAQRRNLSVALYSALGQPTQNLPAVPDSLRPNAAPALPVAAAPAASRPATPAAAPAVATPRQAPNRSASAVVFGFCAQHIVDELRKRDGAIEEFSATLRELAATGDLPENLRAAVEDWMRSGFAVEQCPGQFATQGLRQCLNAMYIALCEVLGPVATDRVLSRAIHAAEELPEAVSFAPKQLL